jgi:hypothetical protein
MKMPSVKFIAINLASLLVVATATATQFRAYFNPTQVQACSARYARTVRIGLERNGSLITASDVQAVSAGADVGVIENLAIVRVKDGPTSAGLAVTINADTGHPAHLVAASGGISFPWQPRALPENLSAACLAYNVYLPANFEFGDRGTLPGLFGVSLGKGATNGERFALPMLWADRGRPRVQAIRASTKIAEAEMSSIDQWSEALPRGRWVRIEQELVLNAPNEANGVARMWIDGTLSGTLPKLQLRLTSDYGIQGVQVDVHFGAYDEVGKPTGDRALKQERLQLSPFEVRWN